MQIRPLVGEAGPGLTSHGSAQPGTAMGQHAQPPASVMSSGSEVTTNGHEGRGQTKQPVKKTSTSRTNGYRAKELAKIKNGLQPFEKADSPGVRIPVSSELRTVSSLSTESSTNSVCSDTGFSSVQEALHKLSNLGYDEVGDQNYVKVILL